MFAVSKLNTMSTKAHFIYEYGIEGYDECLERKTIFGKFVGYNAYLLLENSVLESFEVKDDYLILETKNTDKLPVKFKIWGDAILDFHWSEDGLSIHLEGGHHVTKQIIEKQFNINF